MQANAASRLRGENVSDGPDILHPAVIAQVMVNFAARYGVDSATCLAGTSLDGDLLHRPDTLLERDQEIRLLDNLIAALPDVEAAGFELGLQYDLAVFGTWGFALRVSRTVKDALALAIRYLPLSTAYCRFSTFSDSKEYAVVADPSPVPSRLRQFLLERDTATALILMRQLGLAGVAIKRIEYQGTATPAHAARIRALCGMAPVYGATRNALIVNRKEVEVCLPTHDPNWASIFEARCRAEIEFRRGVTIAERVQQALTLVSSAGAPPNLDDVARRLALSPRTLRRRLQSEGVGFRALVDLNRRTRAAQLLRDTDMKLSAIAAHLGYNDAASFRRAFHRWFGLGPLAYRRARPAPGHRT